MRVGLRDRSGYGLSQWDTMLQVSMTNDRFSVYELICRMVHGTGQQQTSLEFVGFFVLRNLTQVG